MARLGNPRVDLLKVDTEADFLRQLDLHVAAINLGIAGIPRDRIRLHVDANSSGYLYVVMQGSSGTWKLLFPSAEVAGGSNLVHKGESRQIPSGDRGQFVFDEQAGSEKLFIVLTRQPEPDLDKLIYSMGGTPGAKDRSLVPQASVSDNVVSKLRTQSRDLVFEKVDASENAAYVVNPSTAPDARLVVDVALKHK